MIGRLSAEDIEEIRRGLAAARCSHVGYCTSVGCEVHSGMAVTIRALVAEVDALVGAIRDRDTCAEACVVMRPYRGCTCGDVEMRAAAGLLPEAQRREPGVDTLTTEAAETMSASQCDAMGEVPTEFVEGEWCWPTDDSDPAAVVTYSEEPSPETGHVGWMWWALGAMGDAPTYEAACAAAVAEIQRRMDDRMAIL